MRKHFIFLAAAILTVTGAGCVSSDSPVSLDKYQAPYDSSESMTLPKSQEPSGQPAPETKTETATSPTAVGATPTSTVVQPNQPTSTNMTTTTTETKEPEKLAFPGILPAAEVTDKQIRIKTDKGEIVLELLPKEGPKAASNFVYLVQHKFYDGLVFHRVVPGFVIQGGDPLGTGRGNPGYSFEDDKVNLPYKAGIVAMANSGPNTNGSQFFIMLEDNLDLPPSYSVFGRVTKGLDVVRKIAVGDKMLSVTVENKK